MTGEPFAGARAPRGSMGSPPPANVIPLRQPSARDVLAVTWLPVVMRWCRALGGPRVDPDDAAHDVMLVVLARHGDLRDPSAIRSFVFGVTRRTLAAHRRRAWVRRWVGSPVPDVRSNARDPEEDVEERWLAARVAAVLERLTVDHREVIVLVEVEGWSLEEASDLLTVPLGTVKSRLTRARANFAEAARAAGLHPDREGGT